VGTLAVRRQVRAALAEVQGCVPHPWCIDAFVTRLAARRRRPIELVSWPLRAEEQAPTGLWIPTSRADYVFYDDAAAPARRAQIIGHELGHMLLAHTPRLTDAPDGLVERLTPALSPELARRLLGMARTGYAEREEAAAELFGTSLARLAGSQPEPARGDELGRLTEALR
jgi:IrrE N-terminal-like domain